MTRGQKFLWGAAITLGVGASIMPAIKLYDLIRDKLSGSVRVHDVGAR